MTKEELNQTYTDLCAQLGHNITVQEQLKTTITQVQAQARKLAQDEAAAEKAKVAVAAAEVIEENAPLLAKLAD